MVKYSLKSVAQESNGTLTNTVEFAFCHILTHVCPISKTVCEKYSQGKTTPPPPPQKTMKKKSNVYLFPV